MKTSLFDYDLPRESIARYPDEKRGESRMMILDGKSGTYVHSETALLPDALPEKSLLVFNNSRVRKARLEGRCDAGPVEVLLLERISPPGVNSEFRAERWTALLRPGKRVSPGCRIELPEGLEAFVVGREAGSAVLEFPEPPDEAMLERNGRIPLPPYIKRRDEALDAERYQTIYARETGSAAAPTAGLHFSREMFNTLDARGFETAFITLHVGLGTFLPVRSDDAEGHVMHAESFCIDDEAANKIETAKREGRPVVAVGTTTLRALETAWDGEKFRRGRQRSSIFIYGDYDFKTADILFTNFHTPKSTLLMLVSSFCGRFLGEEAGRTALLAAYRAARDSGYRFFSYGDAMLIV